jgi:DNA-binding protein HU-beta
MAQAKKGKKGNNDAMVAAEIGAGILAAAGAAAAGFYYYGGKEAAKHRRKTAKWANDMKNQVVKEAKKQAKVVAKLDKQAMAVIVDRASKAYEGVRNVKPEDLMAAANELKQNWQIIEAELASAAKKGGKVAATVAKQSGKAVKKAAKTATKSASKTAKKVVKKAAPKKAAKKSAKKRA